MHKSTIADDIYYKEIFKNRGTGPKSYFEKEVGHSIEKANLHAYRILGKQDRYFMDFKDLKLIIILVGHIMENTLEVLKITNEEVEKSKAVLEDLLNKVRP